VTPSQSSITSTTAIESRKKDSDPTSKSPHAFDPEHNTYELLQLHNEEYLCTIPIVETPPRNETSEAEAKAAEKKELAQASDRGSALLKELEGKCLYFVSGWWSYSFCYNAEITQFHQLPPQPGKEPIPDPTTAKYTLGRAKGRPNRHDEWGNEVEIRNAKKVEAPKTELQVKGDSRYLVQKMEGGTICDLTGRPRKVEVQYHCRARLPDSIGYIKEITTCSYLLVVNTPRLCDDLAFVPPKAAKTNPIVCRTVVPEEDIAWRYELRERTAQLEAAEPKDSRPNIGGIVVGAGKYLNKEKGQVLLPATDFGKVKTEKISKIIVKAKSKAEGGQVESVSDADLLKMDIDPKAIENMKNEVKKAAKGHAWEIKVTEEAGGMFRVEGLVDAPAGKIKKKQKDEEEEVSTQEPVDEEETGSEEVFKDEL